MYTKRFDSLEAVAAFAANKDMHVKGSAEWCTTIYTGAEWTGYVKREKDEWVINYRHKTDADLDSAIANMVDGQVLGALKIGPRGINAPGRVVLVKRSDKYEPYVTWFQNRQTDGLCHGHYFASYSEAVADFAARCIREARDYMQEG